jgi:membrane-associated protease RseP (regulator of RpoE activity)
MRARRVAVVIGCLMLAISAAAGAQEKKVEKRVVVVGDAKFAGDGEGVSLEGVKRGFLGVSMVALTDELRDYFGVAKGSGVLVSEVVPDGPAAKAGIKGGDVIVSVDGKPVDAPGALGEAIREKKGGDQVKVDVRRRGTAQQFFVTLDERKLSRFEVRIPDVGEWTKRNADGKLEVIELDPGQWENLDRMRVFFESPEFRSRVEKLRGDCSEYQERLAQIEQKMKELERKLEKVK